MILAYHELSKIYDRDVYSISQKTFRRHAILVRSQHGRQTCITFDDGHRSQYELATPILTEMAIPGLFFIVTSWVGLLPSVMLWNEIRKLQQFGHVIGSHTHTHPLLTSCSAEALRNELTVSKDLLEQNLGAQIDSISMPGGRIDTRVLAACGEAGYKYVYTSRPAEYKRVQSGSPNVVGRYIVRASSSDRTVEGYLARNPRICQGLRIESAVKGLVKAITGDSLYQQVWRRTVRSGSYRNSPMP
jgi:peptidoglycan/xylan/chitin deacetylase (PgdA/CDA1 family)